MNMISCLTDHHRWATSSFGDWTSGTLASDGKVLQTVTNQKDRAHFTQAGKVLSRHAKLTAVTRLW